MDGAAGPLRVDAKPSHHISHPSPERASLLRDQKVLANLLMSAIPHTIPIIPIHGSIETGTEVGTTF